jgi:S-DNA-T family DNA segregation ATPase FtsK/SpoIIIE
MASYPARRRDPLLDQETHATLVRRGRELLGLAMLAAGLAVAALLWSYSPDDPSWLARTEAPAENWLGLIGASIASPLTVIAGQASWGVALILLVWGGRFITHHGADRALSRAIFAPIAVAIAAVFASTHVPPAAWPHSFGLGGLFGDTMLGAVLGVAPVSTTAGLKAMAVLTLAAMLALGAYALGFTRPEMRAALRWLATGLVLCYIAALSAGGRATTAARTRFADLRAARAAAAATAPAPRDPSPPRATPALRLPATVTATVTAALTGLLARPAPASTAPIPADPDSGPADDGARIRARIAEVIRARDAVAPPLRREPMVTRAASAPASDVPAPDDPDDIDAIDWPEPELVDPATARAAHGTIPVPEPRGLVRHPAAKPAAPSRQALAEAQPRLLLDDPLPPAWEPPPLSLLTSPDTITRHHLPDEALEENARMLESVLDDYGVKGEIVSVRPGPVVTMYELEPAPGLKASRVIGLADDIARSMSALSARVSTVPGRSVIGIELPNVHREKVVLRELLATRDFGDSQLRLPLALGKDIAGQPVVANLAKMPHLLIAGTTGSGKSVAINTMILSLLYKLSPQDCRLIMIDPKMLELSVYDGIPHLLSPVVTDPKKAVVALKWVVAEMEDRYRKMSKMGVRNIEGFNGRVRDALDRGETFKRTVQTGFDDDTGDPVFETEEITPKALPYIVVIVDEMADLMMVAGKEIEACIQRLAQMARASGIHLIMATQRPSVDVITGTIKANFPTRISFQVTSKIDSRTILGEQGAEQLLGQGDMLYMAGGSKITRVHGPFVSDEEVEEIVSYLKSFGPPDYVGGVVEGPDEDAEADINAVLGLGGSVSGMGAEGDEALYDMAVAIVAKDRKCSTSYIQRKLAIGYNKAARIVEMMEEQGVVTRANGVGKREILVPEV